jgi:hypothetical protein
VANEKRTAELWDCFGKHFKTFTPKFSSRMKANASDVEGVLWRELLAITTRTGNSSPGKLARPHYSFRAPAVKAPTTNFWKTTKIAIAGSSDNMLAAATSCVAEPV